MSDDIYNDEDFQNEEHEVETECPYCDGTGEVWTSMDGEMIGTFCAECGGTGWY
jgi:hypothetical protein